MCTGKVDYSHFPDGLGARMCRYCFVHTYFLYFIKLRAQRFSQQSPRSSTMEMEQEKVNMRKGLSADAASYRCSACHGDEDWALGAPIRGRAKSRSLSASPALASTKEFRRTRSLHGPCPVTTFGPKACVLQNPQTIM